MREKMRQRLSGLEQELQKGEQLLADLRTRETDLRQNMLRIAGAIQVLQEMLDENGKAPQPENLFEADAFSSAAR